MSVLTRLQNKIEELIKNYEILKIENNQLKKRLLNPSFGETSQKELIQNLQDDLEIRDKEIDQLIRKVEEFLE